jgi:hypothetical protein
MILAMYHSCVAAIVYLAMIVYAMYANIAVLYTAMAMRVVVASPLSKAMASWRVMVWNIIGIHNKPELYLRDTDVQARCVGPLPFCLGFAA